MSDNDVKQYEVTVPVTMALSILVEAEGEEDAKQKALGAEFGFEVTGKAANSVSILEWQRHECVTYGAVFCGVINDIEVTEV